MWKLRIKSENDNVEMWELMWEWERVLGNSISNSLIVIPHFILLF